MTMEHDHHNRPLALACFLVFIFVLFVASAAILRAPTPATAPGVGKLDGKPAAVAEAPSALPVRTAGGDTLADVAARLELASDYRPESPRDLVKEALPDAYSDAAWHDVAPYSRQTGKAQKGWVAKDLFTALDFESDPASFGNQLKNVANQLNLFPEDAILNAQINIADGNIVEYQYDSIGNEYVVMDVSFDLPSGRHKYMKLVGRPGTQGGIIIDPSGSPELLAQVMTSSYMHIFIPMIGQGNAEELMFYNESFKSLLSADDRSTATTAMEAADVPLDTP